MLLFPKKTKFQKNFSGKNVFPSKVKSTSLPKYASVVLLANEPGKITNYEFEAVRRFLRRLLKKKAQIFFRVFPNTPITKKPNDVRLGRGKGNLKYWAALIKKGMVLIEVRCSDTAFAKKVLDASKIKLSVKTSTFNNQQRWIL